LWYYYYYYDTNLQFCSEGKGAYITLPDPTGEYTSEFVTQGQCDARPTVTFPAIQHHCPLAGTKLYCLVTEAHVHRVVT